MRALDIADVARRHGLTMANDGRAIDFAGGRILAFGDRLLFVTTIRATSEEAAGAIRTRSEVVNWDSEAGHLTTVFPPSRLAALVQAVRAAESEP